MPIRAFSVGLAALALVLLPAAAHAGPIRAQFSYSFTATQTQEWAYDNQVQPSECGIAPSRGSGTQSASYTAKGKVEATTNLARNKSKAGFHIDASKAKGTFKRQGDFVIEASKISCAGSVDSPDRVADTTRCGTQTASALLTLNAVDSRLTVGGVSKPFDSDQGIVCPFFFFNHVAGAGTFSSFDAEADPDDHDLDQGGLLSTSQKIAGAKLFKGSTVVLKGSRTQRYAPTAEDTRGLTGQTRITWTLTLKPRR